MNRSSFDQPLQLGFSFPLMFPSDFGAFGLLANGVLAGAFRGVVGQNAWYDHPLLQLFRHRFRSADDLTLEADNLAEWLALLQHEGGQLLCPGRIESGRLLGREVYATGAVLYAARRSLFGAPTVLSCWAEVSEKSRSRALLGQASSKLPYPAGQPGDHWETRWLRLAKPLSRPEWPSANVPGLQQGLDALFALAAQHGYALPELADPAARVERLAALLRERQREDERHGFPLFWQDSRCEPLRVLFLQAALLRHQLAQRPSTEPRHHHDDNWGPINPPSDRKGEAFVRLEEGFTHWEEDWNRHGFCDWGDTFDRPEPERLSLRAGGDLLVEDRWGADCAGNLDGYLDWRNPQCVIIDRIS